jgi:hypothetical protein
MIISPYLRRCDLCYQSTEHPSGREVDSGGGEEGEGKGSRDLEKEGGGPRVVEERACVWRRRAGEVEYSSSSPATPTQRQCATSLDLGIASCSCGRPGADEGGGIRVSWGVGGVIYSIDVHLAW